MLTYRHINDTTSRYLSDSFHSASDVKLPQNPTTFEVMVVNIVVGTERIVLASVYHFHGSSKLDFLDELSELD